MDIYSFAVSPWFWLILVIVFTLAEMASSLSLTTIWFAASAFIMVFVSGITESLSMPVRFRLHTGLFLAVAIILFVFTRPLAVKKFKVGKTKTNVDALIGSEARVIKKITRHDTGEIKIRGQIWTAVSEDGVEFAKDEDCVIIRIEGVKAVVSKKTE